MVSFLHSRRARSDGDVVVEGPARVDRRTKDLAKRLQPGEIAQVVADAIGETSAGEQVGVLVFALGGQLVGLEIVGYSDTPAPLPVASTVRSWGG